MDSLFRLRSLAIIGMGKNTGKTSFLNLLLKEAGKSRADRVMALTSMGRDGEDRDLVTGTEKPRIYVHKGTLIATSEELLERCDVTKEIIEITGITSSLGRVVIFRSLSDGFVEIAGPSRRSDLQIVEKAMRNIEENCLFIADGALSRMSFSAETDGAVLCTGAAVSHDERIIFEKTMHALSLLMLEKTEDDLPDTGGRAFLKSCGRWTSVEGDIALSIGREICGQITADTESICLRGAVTDKFIEELLASDDFRNLSLIAGDGTQFLIGSETLSKLKLRGVRLQVQDEISIKMVLMNPYDLNGKAPELQELQMRLRKALDIPVFSLEEMKGEEENDLFQS